MVRVIKRVLRQILTFICNQYFVLFFVLTTSIKLVFFNTLIIKVTWSNDYYFGLVCGLASVAVLFSPLYFAKKHKNKLAVILALLISILLLIDTVYFSYFAALPSVGLLNSLGEAQDVGPAIAGLLNWWLLLYFLDIVLSVVFLKIARPFCEKTKERHNLANQKKTNAMAAMLITLAIFGVTLLPIGDNNLVNITKNAYDTKSTAQYYGLIMAHTIDIVRFIKQETARISPEQKNAIIDWVKNNKPANETDALTGTAKGKNVIMIQVESLGGFVINQRVNGKEVTPNLDQLAKTSQFFPDDRFVIGAGHTSDTDFVANSSYFPMSDTAVFVRYGQDNFSGLPKVLTANGYSAYAYHGFNRAFWSRGTALKSLGYQKFYAAESYPKGTMLNMGLNDGDFLSKTADYIKKQPKPSFSYAITLSSHVPFNTNDQTKELGININDYPNQVGGYLEDINYTDRMLGEFFAKLKTENLYDDSLIIIYGDHTPVLPAFTAGTITYDPTSIQLKEVPLIIKLPNETTGKKYSNQGTHLDIMPTILDLLGVKTSQLMFGQSLFANEPNSLNVCHDQLVVFHGSNCDAKLAEEKTKSAEIIQYNLFNSLPK